MYSLVYNLPVRKAAIIVILASIILGFLFWKYSSLLFIKKVEDKNITLNYWGLDEEETIMRPLIEAYQKAHPNLTINYIRQSRINYRTRLYTQVSAAQGPDIFTIHSSWIPMFTGLLNPSPGETFSIADFTQTFYPVAKDTLVSQNQIFALPLSLDGLVMYYNEDILKAAGVGVPKNWQEFVDSAKKVTVRDSDGQIQTAGASMGTTNNINFWPEILGLLFLQQPNGNLTTPSTGNGEEVLQFYTSFVIDPKNKTWDTTLPKADKMFSEGKLAFYFGNFASARQFKLENPNLNFKAAPVPQLPGTNVSWGEFWALGVAPKTNQKEAWEFIKYLTSADALQYISQAEAQTGVLGRPSPRIDMAAGQLGDPILGAFILQAPTFKSWYLNSTASDAGLNDDVIKAYGEAVNAVLQGRDVKQSLQITEAGIKEAFAKYQPTPTPTKR